VRVPCNERMCTPATLFDTAYWALRGTADRAVGHPRPRCRARSSSTLTRAGRKQEAAGARPERSVQPR
jgi:hypothetical protein